RRQSHLDPNLARLADVDSIDQAEFIDIDRNLRVVAGLKSLDDLQLQDLFLCRIHFTLILSTPRPMLVPMPHEAYARPALRISHDSESHVTPRRPRVFPGRLDQRRLSLSRGLESGNTVARLPTSICL